MRCTTCCSVIGLALGLWFTAAGAAVYSPAKVTDLVAGVLSDSTVLLTFTDSGDDCLEGWAASYEIRQASVPITRTNYSDCSVVAVGTPAGAGGTSDSRVIGGLHCGMGYYFAIAFTDDEGHRSWVSNSADASMPICVEAVTDLRLVEGKTSQVIHWTSPAVSGGRTAVEYDFGAPRCRSMN